MERAQVPQIRKERHSAKGIRDAVSSDDGRSENLFHNVDSFSMRLRELMVYEYSENGYFSYRWYPRINIVRPVVSLKLMS